MSDEAKAPPGGIMIPFGSPILQVAVLLLGTGTTSVGGAYIGAQSADSVVVKHQVGELTKQVGELTTQVGRFKSELDVGTGSRWTREQHDHYAEGTEARIRQIEQDMADLH